MTDRVDITVALCTWNRADLLDQTLRGLAQVVPPPGRSWEVLVVDNNSSDHTPQVLAEHAGGPLALRAVREARQGHCHARNCGLLHARGDWVVWTDDDVRPDPGWLQQFAATAARHPHAAAVGGPIRPWFPEAPDPDLLATFKPLRIGFCGVDHGPTERELLAHEAIYGANMAYRTAAVSGLRFDPTLGRNGRHLGMHDDTAYLDQVRARGGTVVWSPGMGLEHYVEPARMTVGYARRFCRESVHLPDPAADPSPRLAGAPRWLWRRAAAAGLTAVSHLRPGHRRPRLAALVDLWSAQGLIAAHRRAGRSA